MESPSASAVAATEALLEVRELTARYGDREVLRGLSFHVARGEIFGLLGPNGSGKSTAFSILTGGLRSTGGVITLDGAVLAAGDRRLRERLGVVFQQPSLDPRLSARENLTLSAALYGLSRKDTLPKIEQALAFADLVTRADEPVARYSGGMRRRLELVRAMIHAPDVLLMDEPTTGLDETSFQRTWARIEALRRDEGLTVLLTTHRPEEAEKCDRLAIVDGGRVVAEGTPAELKARVSGDVITLEADDTSFVASELRAKLDLESTLVDGRLMIERSQGHAWIPRIVEALPQGALRTVSMHRPSLADAFLKLTGRSLGTDTDGADDTGTANRTNSATIARTKTPAGKRS